MTIEEQLIEVMRRRREIRQALSLLESLGITHESALVEFNALTLKAETFVPKFYPDRFRIRSNPIDITEHLTGNRDMVPSLLHSPTSNGRAYTLTKGQRAILRERYGMTPTKEVIVTEIAVWPAAPNCVQHVSLRSTDHVDVGRKHVLNACVITDWVEFCSAVETYEANEAISADKERLSARLDKLFEKAKSFKVEHSCTKGKVLYRWLAEYDSIPESDAKPEHVRNALREVLLSLNEPKLAEIVKEPSFFKDEKKETARNEKFSDLLSQYL